MKPAEPPKRHLERAKEIINWLHVSIYIGYCKLPPPSLCHTIQEGQRCWPACAAGLGWSLEEGEGGCGGGKHTLSQHPSLDRTLLIPRLKTSQAPTAETICRLITLRK